MIEVVLDASVAVSAVAGRSDTDLALRARLVAGTCHAPHLIDAEVGNVLRKQVAIGAIEAETAEAGLVALDSLVGERYPHGVLVRAAWRLRHNVTFYDALYVALAARLEVPLLTADERLSRAGLPCEVEVLT
jgi:predicted nucleic acid-binding protein